jgi:hypothetical protein
MTKTNYTFGDSDEASLRLRNLVNLYEPDTRSLLKRSEVDRPRLAIDLGCGQGWSPNPLMLGNWTYLSLL